MLDLISAIAVLLVLSAFFSGSETALTGASRPMMYQLERTGSRRARIVNRLYASKERLIGAILLGNNLVNILASALATSALIALFGEAGVAYATIGMTLLVLIFAEILPKTYAFKNANRMALALAPVVNGVVWLLAPVTTTIQAIIRALLKPFGVDVHADEMLGISAEELRGAIDLHARDSQSETHERAMLRSVLDLSEVWVGEIMTHRRNMVTINADLRPDEIVEQVLQSPYTRIPLWRGSPDEVVGVLHAKALLRAVRAGEGGGRDLDVPSLAATPWFIPESTSLLDQLQAFRERREHFALVVDEYGSLQGVVTLEDILEEIVGEIDDEHDVAVRGVRHQPDGSFLVQGSVTIRDLNRELEWNLPDAEAATIAGMILHESRRIPEVGQTFRFHDFRFEIVRRQRQRIALVRITPPERKAEAPAS